MYIKEGIKNDRCFWSVFRLWAGAGSHSSGSKAVKLYLRPFARYTINFILFRINMVE
ncbi:hypothetical protein CLOHYLEM_04865 [[Clostridium] hylemonae DSM 15053]|uniref:Uncharacterized protein n=1 Tax=[Clostridium] hylemonae DSM 15053 TaxID=553973 RepID=C0BYH6_9FIRM|nr:hypothetical protein CLOHYLEM_04865 [[Clostridium] hylemonae DSM 15053]